MARPLRPGVRCRRQRRQRRLLRLRARAARRSTSPRLAVAMTARCGTPARPPRSRARAPAPGWSPGVLTALRAYKPELTPDQAEQLLVVHRRQRRRRHGHQRRRRLPRRRPGRAWSTPTTPRRQPRRPHPGPSRSAPFAPTAACSPASSPSSPRLNAGTARSPSPSPSCPPERSCRPASSAAGTPRPAPSITLTARHWKQIQLRFASIDGEHSHTLTVRPRKLSKNHKNKHHGATDVFSSTKTDAARRPDPDRHQRVAADADRAGHAGTYQVVACHDSTAAPPSRTIPNNSWTQVPASPPTGPRRSCPAHPRDPAEPQRHRRRRPHPRAPRHAGRLRAVLAL